MQLGQGCRKRTPWWCWLLLAVLASAALPGAAFQATAGENGGGKREQNTKAEQWTPVETERLAVIYAADDVLKRAQDDYHVDGERAREILLKYFENPHHFPRRRAAVDAKFAWHDDGLVVYATRKRHEEFSKHLELLRKTGFRTIRLDTMIATADEKLVNEIIGDWRVLPGEQEDQAVVDFNALTFDDVSPVESFGGRRSAQGQATQTIERRSPATMHVLDEEHRAAVMQALEGDTRSNLISCPKVTLFDRQKAVVADTVQRPFVIGVKQNAAGESEPSIRVVTEGLTVRLHPQIESENRLRLSCGVTFSDIHDVETTTIPLAGEEPITLQVPEVATMKIDSLVALEDGKTLAIGGLKRRDRDGKTESLLVLIRARIVPLLDNNENGNDRDDVNDADAKAASNPPLPRDLADATANARLHQEEVENWQALKDRRQEGDSKLFRKLEKKVDVAWSNVALQDALQWLAQVTDLNITIDGQGLKEEGVTRSVKVSLELKRVSVKRVLTSLLEPLHLAYRVDGETLQVTSRQRARGKMVTMIYAVADLVVPVAQTVHISKLERTEIRQEKKPAVEFNALTELISSTVAPDTWVQAGGEGSIAPFETNLSLVVRQAEEVHDEIADLLEQLRRLQNIQVGLEVRTVRVSSKRFDWISRHPKVLHGKPLADFLTSLEGRGGDAARRGPKITLFNGQGLEWKLDEEFTSEAAPLLLQLQPVVSADRRHVRLSVAVNADNALSALASAESVAVPDGASVVFDLTEELHTRNAVPAGVANSPQVRDLLAKSIRRRGGERTLCIITPTILVIEEEEVLATPAGGEPR